MLIVRAVAGEHEHRVIEHRTRAFRYFFEPVQQSHRLCGKVVAVHRKHFETLLFQLFVRTIVPKTMHRDIGYARVGRA